MIELNLPIKPYSVNAYFYGNRSIKRREAVEWEASIIEFLRNKDIQKKISKFRESFDATKHSLSINIITTYPKDILYTKKGMLSSRAFDISNTEKPLIDVIFLAKYSTNTTKNLEIDDKYITSMKSEKVAGEDYNISIKIQLSNLPHRQDK